MLLRRAELSDLEFIVDVYNSTIPSRMVTADTSPVTAEEKSAWFHSHSESYPLWIINSGETPAGWASIRQFYGRVAYKNSVEISIYIDEKWRGHGLGRKVLRQSIINCRELGHHTLLGFIFLHNQPSIRLFKNCGFEQWGLLPALAEMDNVFYDLAILGLKLR